MTMKMWPAGFSALMLSALALAVLTLAPTGASAEGEVSFEAKAGAEYDSNITVPATDVDSGEGDYSIILDLDVGYELDLGNADSIEVGYSFNQSLQFDLSEFDIQIHGLTVGYEHDFGDVNFGVDGGYYYTTLGGDGFLKLTRISPNVSYFPNNSFYLRASYNYSDLDLIGRTDRDSTINGASLDAFFLFDGIDKYLSIGYDLELRDATDPEFDFDGHQATIRFQNHFTLAGRETRYRFGWQYEKRDYSSVTPSIGEVRNDNRHTLSAELEYPLSDRFFILAEYRYRDFSSNLPSADYTENLVALSLGFEF